MSTSNGITANARHLLVYKVRHNPGPSAGATGFNILSPGITDPAYTILAITSMCGERSFAGVSGSQLSLHALAATFIRTGAESLES